MIHLTGGGTTTYVESIKQAGLSFCRTEVVTVISNVASAPFDKAGSFRRHAECSEGVPGQQRWHQRPLLGRQYPNLSSDQNDGVLPDRINSPEHMFQTWESLRGCSSFLTKGEKINQVVPVQSHNADCAVHGIISAPDDHSHRDAGPWVSPRRREGR